MRKLHRELQREFPYAQITKTRGNHLRLRLPNGQSVFVAATPSCHRYAHNVRRDVKRVLSATKPPHAGNY